MYFGVTSTFVFGDPEKAGIFGTRVAVLGSFLNVKEPKRVSKSEKEEPKYSANFELDTDTDSPPDVSRECEAEDGGEGMGLKEKIDIFKATSAWYLGLRKRPKDDDEQESGETFAALRSRINGKGATQ